MDTVEDKKLAKLLSVGDGLAIQPEHRAWMNAEIQKTLEKKNSCRSNYVSLDEVRRRFGLG